MKIVSARRFGIWTKLFQRWIKKQFNASQAWMEENILPSLPKPGTSANVDDMFATATSEGEIIVDSSAIDKDGTMTISVFTAITGLTPV